MITDDDNTPPIRALTPDEIREHYREYPRGTPAVSGDGPMPREMAGPESQQHLYVAHLERRLDAQDKRLDILGHTVGSLTASRDATKKLLWLVIPALVGGLATALVFAAETIASSAARAGKVEATLEALKEQHRSDHEEINQLRAALLRLGAGDPHRPTSDSDHPAPDWMSWLNQGASTPASTIGDSGRVLRHVPKLQYGHGLVSPLLHSKLLEHTDPHSDRGNTWAGRLGVGDALQAAMTTSTRMVFSIPEM